jgi:hypothetical protein
MALDPFIFLRATYYRWAQLSPYICPQLNTAPEILAIGDLHIQNFGTWLDSEGRLVWGVNDFDEAAKLPYTNDLIRLAVSIKLSLEADHHSLIEWKAACADIAEGYGDAMADAVENINLVAPIVLAETEGWLAKLAASQAIDPELFWHKLLEQTSLLKPSQKAIARTILEKSFPVPVGEIEWTARSAGEGSLGRPRYVGITKWRGGYIAREAKTLAPSAALWAGATESKSIRYQKIVDTAVRSCDPFLQIKRIQKNDWVIRRLSPSCTRIDFEKFKSKVDDKFFHAVGHEIANIHINQPKRAQIILEHFTKLGPSVDWLYEATIKMERAVLHDYDVWKEYHTSCSDN